MNLLLNQNNRTLKRRNLTPPTLNQMGTVAMNTLGRNLKIHILLFGCRIAKQGNVHFAHRSPSGLLGTREQSARRPVCKMSRWWIAIVNAYTFIGSIVAVPGKQTGLHKNIPGRDDWFIRMDSTIRDVTESRKTCRGSWC